MLVQQALAPMIMSRLALPVMREQKSGVIINVASDAAKVPTPGESVIGAAMAAIRGFLAHACDRGEARRHPGQRADALADRQHRRL